MSGVLASMCKSEMKSVVTRVTSSRGSGGGYALDSLDDDLLQGGIFLEWAPRTGCHVADAIHDIHAQHDFAEHGISPPCLIGIERRVVEQIHVELAVAGVRLRRACHTHRTALVGQSVARFVDDFSGSAFELVGGVEAASLNHKIWNHAMEYRPGVKPLIYMFQELRDGERRTFRQQFNREASQRGHNLHMNGTLRSGL